MNPLILVSGNSGTGKRTVSKFLEDILENYRRFSSDDTRRELGKLDYDLRDTPEVFSHMYGEISEILRNQGGVIVHSHYRTSEGRQGAYDIAADYGIPVLLIECVCPEEVAKSRIMSRPKKDELHSPPTDPAVYDRLKAIWEDIGQDFAGTKNKHVSWIRYNSHTSEVRGMLVRNELRHFSSQIMGRLQFFNPKPLYELAVLN